MRRLIGCAVASMVLALWVAGPASAWSWPLRGELLRPFSLGADAYAAGQHRGVDIAGEPDEDVLAPAPGTVTFTGSVPTHGKVVTILTPDGLSVTLTHLGAIGVEKGAAVGEGQVVGRAGVSGTAEHPGPYVHLGVRLAADDNGYLDPLRFLPPRGAGPALAPTPSAVASPVAATGTSGSATAPAIAAAAADAGSPAAAPAVPAAVPDTAGGHEQPTPTSGSGAAPAVAGPAASAAVTTAGPTVVDHGTGDAAAPASDGGHADAAAVATGARGVPGATETTGSIEATASGQQLADRPSTPGLWPDDRGTLARPSLRARSIPDIPDAGGIATTIDVLGVDGRPRPGRVAARPLTGLPGAWVPAAARAGGPIRHTPVPPDAGGHVRGSTAASDDGSTTPRVQAVPHPRGAIALPVRRGGEAGIPGGVPLALVLLVSILVAATAATRSARRIERDGALLHHHPDLLRQLDAAHRPRVHDDRGRRLRATPEAARA